MNAEDDPTDPRKERTSNSSCVSFSTRRKRGTSSPSAASSTSGTTHRRAEKRLHRPHDSINNHNSSSNDGGGDLSQLLADMNTSSPNQKPAAQPRNQSHSLNSTTPRIHLRDLPEEILTRITSCLTAPELLDLRRVNRYFARLAARNEAGWDYLCERLWHDKVHVCAEARALRKQGQDDSTRHPHACQQAYCTSLQDATARQHVRLQDEFLYDPVTKQGTVWSFRFKAAAGTDWTQMDPWYQGRPARQMVFLADGSCQQYHADEGGRVGQVHLGNAAATAPAVGNNNNHPPQQDGDAANGRPRRGLMPVTMRWRLLTRPMDLPTRPLGSYVRVTVSGRDVPTYAVRRSPAGGTGLHSRNNWGFIMESCWGLFASFPLPVRLAAPPPPAPTGTIPRPVAAAAAAPGRILRRRLRRTSEGTTRWVWELDDEPEGPNGSTADTNDPWAALRDDSHLLITNEVQWREAFLYNVGARVLPEGDEATDDFDRAWGGLGNG